MASETRKVLEDLNLSNDELERLTKAFKQEEFRKLFKEYADELADPENRKRYEEEIRQMEMERGMDVQFVNPDPGYVVKTTCDGNLKAFINICRNDLIEKPQSCRQTGPDGKTGLSWSIPHSFAPPRDDTDNNANKCKVFDFVIHPDTYRMAETNARFKQMIHDTAFDGIEKQFNVKLDRKNLKFPKMKFKGTPVATVIRRRNDTKPKERHSDDIMNSFPYPYDNKTSDEKACINEENARKREQQQKKDGAKSMKSEKEENDFTEPTYVIKHRHDLDFQNFTNAPDSHQSTIPKELVVEVDLPLLKSAAPVSLDIFEKKLSLKSTEPAKYNLNLTLPYAVDENQGSAKFDKSKRKLCITLPVTLSERISEPTQSNGHSYENEQNGFLESEDKSTPIPSQPQLQSKPLIEVLDSKSIDKPEEIIVESEQIEVRPSNDTGDSENENPKIKGVEQRKHFTLPSYDFHQDDETISLIVHAGKVDRSTVSIAHPSSHSCTVMMTSVGSGGFPLHYKLHLQFPEDCTVEQQHSRADVDTHNVVIVLVKTDASIGQWEKFAVGLEEDNLEEKLFLTRSNLQKQLSGLVDDNVVESADSESAPELELTEMDKEKLTVQFKNEGRVPRKKCLSESAEDFEVVHRRQAPPLRSIIKRSVSESSDDIYSLGSDEFCQRQRRFTCGSEGSLIESDENLSEGKCTRKSVSFSKHIDQTTYQTNQSVTVIAAKFRNKRKNQRKAERRIAEKQERRRRRSSGSEGASSDDLSSNSQARTSVKGKKNTDAGKAQKSKSEVDVRLDVPPGCGMEGDDESSPTVDKENIVNQGVKLASSIENDALKTSDSEIDTEPGTNLPKVSSNVIKGDDENITDSYNEKDINVQLDSDDGFDENDTGSDKEGMVEDSKKCKESAFWKEQPAHSEHVTNCAFDFANSIIYDLDVD